MKNKVELREERGIVIAEAFIGTSTIRNHAEKVQDNIKPDEFVIFDKIKGWTLLPSRIY